MKSYELFFTFTMNSFLGSFNIEIQGCGNPYEATAHVLINDGRKGGGTHKWWLVPTCAGHNSKSVTCFDVNPSTIFVGVTDLRRKYNV